MSEAIEIEQIRELARQFAESELRPHVEAWDAARALPPAALDQLAELGFYGMLIPEEFGGMGFDLPTYLSALEELSWGEPVIALLLSIHNAFGSLILAHGSAAQKARWLEGLAAGRERACFALSEADAGSDAGAIATTATRDGDGWRIAGEKKWVTYGNAATLALVAARTAEGGARGVSLFLVPLPSDGIEVVHRETTMGLRAADVVTLRLDVRLDGDTLLGEEGKGFAYAMEGLDRGRLGIAAQAIGIAQAALDHALAYAAERRQFDAPIREFEAIQFKLADMVTRTEAARALLHVAAREPSTQRSSMAKLFASETAMWVTTQAVQIFGGYGYMRDYPVEKLMRDAKATEIYEGTNEIQRIVIARALYA
ncbi:MAG TPA: acyl-CoA dehydrogenase family protein [Longimicrobiales bacterium]|nr:acyl-CoA dehydrogenase family protein [Longimicrobiales bacterium]